MRVKLLVLCVPILLSGCNVGNVKNDSTGIGSVDIFPDQKVSVQALVVEGEISEVSKVLEGGSFSFELSQRGDGMMLSAKNQLDVIVKYDIYMIDYAGKKHYTSSCPLMPGAGAFESWPHKIPAMSIENFRVLPKDGELACQ